MTKRKKNKKRVSKQPGKDIPEEARQTLTEIIELTDAFCQKHLNEEYRELCEDMAAMLYAVSLPIEKGRRVSWAGGIVHAIGWVNFLQDPGQSPHMTSEQVAKGFGVSQATMTAKSKIIRDELDLFQLHPGWCLPSMLEDNPLVWMLEVNGFIMDIRMAPREAQEEAYRLGLIPYIPADRQEPGPESGTGTNIIKFPSPDNEASSPKSQQRSKDDGPSLFERPE